MQSVRATYHNISYNIVSDTAENVAENINKGLLDFGLMLRRTKNEGLDYLPFKCKEQLCCFIPETIPHSRKRMLLA